jgi:hypothetical protein
LIAIRTNAATYPTQCATELDRTLEDTRLRVDRHLVVELDEVVLLVAGEKLDRRARVDQRS